MYGLLIVIIILIIAAFAYFVLLKPAHERIITRLGTGLWLVDKAAGSDGASFYIQFGEFKQDPQSAVPSGVVHFTKYGNDKAYEYDSSLEWSSASDSLRVGQMKLQFATTGLNPTIMYTNNIGEVNSWTAPLRSAQLR